MHGAARPFKRECLQVESRRSSPWDIVGLAVRDTWWSARREPKARSPYRRAGYPATVSDSVHRSRARASLFRRPLLVSYGLNLLLGNIPVDILNPYSFLIIACLTPPLRIFSSRQRLDRSCGTLGYFPGNSDAPPSVPQLPPVPSGPGTSQLKGKS